MVINILSSKKTEDSSLFVHNLSSSTICLQVALGLQPLDHEKCLKTCLWHEQRTIHLTSVQGYNGTGGKSELQPVLAPKTVTAYKQSCDQNLDV